MRFNTTVEGARWDEDARVWLVALADGETLRAQFLILATGYLCQPCTPDIPGIDTFDGRIVHAAQWDDSQSLQRDDVRQSSAPDPPACSSFPSWPRKSRSSWSISAPRSGYCPKLDLGFTPAVQRLFARVPLAQRILRWSTDIFMDVIVGDRDVEIPGTHRSTGPRHNIAAFHRFLSIRDKDLRRWLTLDTTTAANARHCPIPITARSPGRTCICKTSGIERIEPDGIVACDGTKISFIDTLVLATGFDVWEANLPAIEAIGREGRNLGKWWRENRFQAYEGVSVPWFPNFLHIKPAPTRGSGMSWFNTVEYQMRHMNRLFGELQRRGAQHFRGHRTGQCPLPRSDDRVALLFGVPPRQLRDITVVLVQRFRGSISFSTDVGV